MQTSLQTTTDEKAASKLDIHERKAHARPRSHQPIHSTMRSWVRGKSAWFSGGERERPILRFLSRLFWGKCPAKMTHHPNGQS